MRFLARLQSMNSVKFDPLEVHCVHRPFCADANRGHNRVYQRVVMTGIRLLLGSPCFPNLFGNMVSCYFVLYGCVCISGTTFGTPHMFNPPVHHPLIIHSAAEYHD